MVDGTAQGQVDFTVNSYRTCAPCPALSRRQALATFSPRQLRLMFLLQPWDKSMMYGEGAQQEMRTREAALRNFFANVQVTWLP